MPETSERAELYIGKGRVCLQTQRAESLFSDPIYSIVAREIISGLGVVQEGAGGRLSPGPHLPSRRASCSDPPSAARFNVQQHEDPVGHW